MVEVELRMNRYISEIMYMTMSEGMFGDLFRIEIQDISCSWLPDGVSSKTAKLRTKSNREMTAKIAICVQEAVPGIRLAGLYEYTVVGEIMRLEYITTMTELNVSTRIDDIST
ncbi:hypothetical protein AYO21_11809 [Fonsecaea monophora]|uniref:Uncharacterized protein n=1 Tax=Fonsecaea monophora TaxID=254056 RepID=A0A177ERF5_9EURO|nr:hypothetical protein AYO21_11809 [Fonsecaea monophora]OAG34041.1 hypothetical protein AYO21_11809 [Fonsecaea monophora]